MDFYKILSKYYDEIFKMQQETLQFLDKDLNEQGIILDMACGGFSYGLELAKDGKEVIGIDINRYMIEKAEEKSKEINNVEFFNEDIRNINVIFKDLRFKEIFCIGNSLAYLPFKSEVLDVIEKSYKILADDGTFIIDTINYDRILESKKISFPQIIDEKSHITLDREYKYIEDLKCVEFSEVLNINKEENKTYNNTVTLLPLLKSELVKMLQDAGFINIEVFGDYTESKWSKDSYNTILKAKK